MSELTLSTQAVEAMQEAGWKYYAHRGGFERDYYRCNDASAVARDISDFTSYKVIDYDTSVDEGYWYVSLSNDDECYDFARRYNEYYDMRQRINHALFNGVLLITNEQYKQVIDMVRDYNKRFIAGHVMIVIPDDAFTRQVIAILDALGM